MPEALAPGARLWQQQQQQRDSWELECLQGSTRPPQLQTESKMGSASCWLYTPCRSQFEPVVLRNRNQIKPNINKPNTGTIAPHSMAHVHPRIEQKKMQDTKGNKAKADFLLQVKSRQSISTDKGQDSSCLCRQKLPSGRSIMETFGTMGKSYIFPFGFSFIHFNMCDSSESILQ